MSAQSDRLVLATAADEAYAIPLAAMLRSIVDHLPADCGATLLVIDGGISAAIRDKLMRSCEADNLEVQWIPARPLESESTPSWGRLGGLTYQRLLLPELLEGESKALYLDPDVIVRRDLDQLWHSDSSGHTLCAAQDQAVPYVSSTLGLSRYRELGISPRRKYFNAGVMLIDLQRWRRQEVTRRCFEYLLMHRRSVILMEQDALNVVVGDDWRELDPRWNQIASIAGRKMFGAPHLRRLAADPWIIHFAGTFKPWKANFEGPGAEEFFRNLDETPWAGWRPRPTWRDRALHVYDRRLRWLAYPLESIYTRWSCLRRS